MRSGREGATASTDLITSRDGSYPSRPLALQCVECHGKHGGHGKDRSCSCVPGDPWLNCLRVCEKTPSRTAHAGSTVRVLARTRAGVAAQGPRNRSPAHAAIGRGPWRADRGPAGEMQGVRFRVRTGSSRQTGSLSRVQGEPDQRGDGPPGVAPVNRIQSSLPCSPCYPWPPFLPRRHSPAVWPQMSIRLFSKGAGSDPGPRLCEPSF